MGQQNLLDLKFICNELSLKLLGLDTYVFVFFGEVWVYLIYSFLEFLNFGHIFYHGPFWREDFEQFHTVTF